MYFCASVVDNQCTAWAPLALLPEGAGMQIGWALLAISVTAWSFRYIANFLINKR